MPKRLKADARASLRELQDLNTQLVGNVREMRALLTDIRRTLEVGVKGRV